MNLSRLLKRLLSLALMLGLTIPLVGQPVLVSAQSAECLDSQNVVCITEINGGTLLVAGEITSSGGSFSGLSFQDRRNPDTHWTWYSRFDQARLYNGVARLTVGATGNVEIGTETNDGTLLVAGEIRSSGGTFPGFSFQDRSNPDNIWTWYSRGGQARLYNGTEKLVIDGAGNVGMGTNSPQAKLDVRGTTITRVLQITGGADLAEPFAINATTEIEPGTVVILDADNPGELRVANGAYDPLVAGIISGAGDIKPGLIMQQEEEATVNGEMHPVALTGKVYVKAVGPIQVGDLLTTADVAGHAMAATDRDKAFGTTLGKAMSSLDKGTGLVLVLVALQ